MTNGQMVLLHQRALVFLGHQHGVLRSFWFGSAMRRKRASVLARAWKTHFSLNPWTASQRCGAASSQLREPGLPLTSERETDGTEPDKHHHPGASLRNSGWSGEER